MKTPKQKLEPVESLSGIKQLLKTPKQKLEPVEALSGIKQLMKTPKQKLEPVESLSGIKQLMKTPKQKLEPAEALSGIKQLMKTPKQKLEAAEALSGIKQLMKTPKQKLEPVEALSGIKQLMRTPRRKAEPVEHLSGIKQLLRTPQQELEPVTDEIALKRLLETPVESREAVKALPDVTSTRKTPKLKSQPVEDMVGISRIFQTPKEKVEPIDNMFGISRLMKSPKEKYQPVEDFVGLQRLMAEPRQKSDSEVDYAGVTEMFGTPEEVKVRSVNVMDSQEEIPPPGSNSSQKHEKKGNVSQGEDSQEKDSTGEEQHTQRPRRGRPKRAVPPTAAKPSGNGVSLKELQSPDTQEEMGAITPENKGRRGRRAKRYVQEVVPKRPDQEGLDTVSSVEPAGAAQRPGRGQRKELKELKHPNENLESCVEDSSVVPANTQQSLQDCGINETEDDPGTKTGAGNTQNEICQLQTGLNNPDSKANDSGIEDSEEVLLSPRRRRRGAENTEPVIPPKRGRRARNDRGRAASPGDLCATTRKLRKDPSPKATQRQEQACDKAPEAVTAQESENDTKLELKATDTRVKSFRSTRSRKCSDEIKAGTREVTLENTQSIQKTEETSAGTDAETQSHMKNEIKGTQGCETENAQEKTTEAARRLKAESPYAGTNKMPVSAQKVEANRARHRRGKIDSLEQKADEFTENVNGLKPIISKFKSETEVDESSLQSSVGSVCVSAAEARKEQPSPGATSVPAAGSASPAQGSQRRTRKEQGILKAKQTEILRGDPAQGNAGMCRRGRGRKVNFQLEEGSSKAVEGKTLPGDDEGMAEKDNQRGNSENPSSQGRRGRRKQLDSTPQEAGHALMEKQTLSADHRKDEAVVTEQGSALEAAPSSAEDNPPRRGRRREAAAASQTRSPSVRTRRGVLEGDAKKVAERKDEIPALGNKTSQAKVNASARDRRRKMDPAAEATGSAPLQGKCGLSEIKGEGTQEEQGVPLEAVSCAKEKPPGRGRRKETTLASHATNSISLRGKRALPAGDGEEAPKEAQNVPLETCDPSGKENHLRRGRRKEIAPLIEAKSSIQGNQVLSKQGSRRNNNREAKPSLDNSSQENKDLVKGSSRQATISLALSPTSLQGLPEDGKDGIPEEQSKLLEVAPPTKENPSRVGRKKTTSSTSEETISTSLRGRPNLPRGRGQKRILKEHEDASPENNPCQGRTRQLRNNRRKVEFPLEAASSTSPHKSSDLPENGDTLETQDLSGASTGSEENQSGKGQEGDPAPQAAPTSRRRKCQLPAEDVAPKKLKSGASLELVSGLRRNPGDSLLQAWKFLWEQIHAIGTPWAEQSPACPDARELVCSVASHEVFLEYLAEDPVLNLNLQEKSFHGRRKLQLGFRSEGEKQEGKLSEQRCDIGVMPKMDSGQTLQCPVQSSSALPITAKRLEGEKRKRVDRFGAEQKLLVRRGWKLLRRADIKPWAKPFALERDPALCLGLPLREGPAQPQPIPAPRAILDVAFSGSKAGLQPAWIHLFRWNLGYSPDGEAPNCRNCQSKVQKTGGPEAKNHGFDYRIKSGQCPFFTGRWTFAQTGLKMNSTKPPTPLPFPVPPKCKQLCLKTPLNGVTAATKDPFLQYIQNFLCPEEHKNLDTGELSLNPGITQGITCAPSPGKGIQDQPEDVAGPTAQAGDRRQGFGVGCGIIATGV
ncbi:hypothetical protein DUI87_11368 [Hirundo rustica rustica]|uniref:Uncharacterized protein n=1 Tax=Hirundo rustica rustica TaxID=333673 RepID=A0A3M0KJR1_HIRRU|nr:hypothetical protein DUI87_11368 [Hirundo rustica rustica]